MAAWRWGVGLSACSLQWEVKVEEGQKSFSECSKTVKAEVKRFEVRGSG